MVCEAGSGWLGLLREGYRTASEPHPLHAVLLPSGSYHTPTRSTFARKVKLLFDQTVQHGVKLCNVLYLCGLPSPYPQLAVIGCATFVSGEDREVVAVYDCVSGECTTVASSVTVRATDWYPPSLWSNVPGTAGGVGMELQNRTFAIVAVFREMRPFLEAGSANCEDWFAWAGAKLRSRCCPNSWWKRLPCNVFPQVHCTARFGANLFN